MPELLPKIAELSAKLQKEPGSRLFVPLAEEYVKAGMLEEAVQVLTDGLKKHPEFLVARVTLGKIYFQQGKFSEARRELEEVVKVSPDNLVALRKLAVLYRQSKLLDQARRCCDTLLAANPKDAEMQQLLQEINAAQSKGQQAEIGISSPKLDVSPAPADGHALELGGDAPAASAPSRDTAPAPPQPPSPPRAHTIPPPEPAQAGPPQRTAEQADAGEEAPEELVSPTLAQLYLRQGHYVQAVHVYDELLRREPHNDTYRQAHSIALALLQGQQSQPQTASTPPVEPAGPAAPTGNRPPAHPNDRVIQRLQSWLLQIQQRRRRAS